MEQQATGIEASENQTLVKHAIRYGAIMGIITIIITVLTYVIDYSLMVNLWYGLVLFVFFIGYVIYAGINYRNGIGGYLPYGKAFQHSFLTFLAGGIVGTIFSLLLYTVIDPDLPENLTKVGIENAEEMMRKFGAPESSIDTEIEKMRVDMPARFSPLGVLKQFGWGLIFYAVFSLITALFVRKNQPENI